jgi:hypothetical protein
MGAPSPAKGPDVLDRTASSVGRSSSRCQPRKPLLYSVMQIPLDPSPGLVGGSKDPSPRCFHPANINPRSLSPVAVAQARCVRVDCSIASVDKRNFGLGTRACTCLVSVDLGHDDLSTDWLT